jgi:hypothetical protein
MEFKAKSTSWGGCNPWENNEVEFFDLIQEPLDVAGGSIYDNTSRRDRHTSVDRPLSHVKEPLWGEAWG